VAQHEGTTCSEVQKPALNLAVTGLMLCSIERKEFVAGASLFGYTGWRCAST